MWGDTGKRVVYFLLDSYFHKMTGYSLGLKDGQPLFFPPGHFGGFFRDLPAEPLGYP